MRTFAQKPMAPRQTMTAKTAMPSLAHFGQSREVNPVLHLRRTIGGQAVRGMLRTNAEEIKAGLTGTPSPRFGYDFSRISIHPATAAAIQTRIANATAGDQYEQEADRVSEQVMRMPEPLRTKSVQASDTGRIAAPPIVREVLRAPGRPLDHATRAFMESRFGHDFSRVRVHSGPAAEQSARTVNARAYTVGHGIVLGAGRLAPATTEGRRLLAHELTHVVQADSTASNPVLRPSSVETLEREARRAAAAVVGADTMPTICGSARGLIVPLRQGPDDPDKATFGNLPRDMPDPSVPLGRVVLLNEGGVWYEERRGGKKFRAEGSYDFVVQNGKIWAVRSSRRIGGRGHTEAAAGGRVEYAGTVKFGRSETKRGVLQEWSNASGHYAPVRYQKFAEAAGLPMDDRFKPLKVEKGFKSQLPVYQPRTRPRGGEPPKVPPGPPRLGALEAHLRASKSSTPAAPPKTPGPAVSTPAAPPKTAGPAVGVPAVPPKTAGPTVDTPGVMPTGGKVSGQTAARSGLSSDTARAIARLDAEATKATQFTGRIRTYVAAYGALQHALSLLDTIDAAEKIFAHGTVFQREQGEADAVAAQSAEALRAAESSTAGNAYFGAVIDIGEAIRNRDQQGLFALAGSLTELEQKLSESAQQMSAMSTDIDAQAQAMLRAARNNKKAATQGLDDAAMAQAAGLYISTEKLGNTLRGAAENYRSAAETLNAFSASINSVAAEAEEAAWAFGYARIIKAQQEIKR